MLQIFGKFTSNVPSTSRSTILRLFNCPKVLSSCSNKENLIAKIIFQDAVNNLPGLPLRTTLKLHNILANCNLVKRVYQIFIYQTHLILVAFPIEELRAFNILADILNIYLKESCFSRLLVGLICVPCL